MSEFLIVVDMQNDFVSGALGTKEAQAILPYVAGRIAQGLQRGEKVLFTRDTHQADYLTTQEGQKLPVPHCIEESEGWQIVEPLQKYAKDAWVVNKPTFGSVALAEHLQALQQHEAIEGITLLGLCTDICVISNALLLKAYFPEIKIRVEAAGCAGVTPESHENALRAMQMCQIEILA